MFSIPKVNVIESSDGYIVEVLGRTGILYKEGDRYIHIDSEVLAGPSGVVVYTDSIKSWCGPNEVVPVDEVDRERIVSNIKAAFRFRGYNIEVN